MRAHDHINTSKQTFVAALFVNSPKQETTQIFINKYINKLLYLYNGILLGTKVLHVALMINLKVIMLKEARQTEEAILYDSIHINF